MPFCWKNLCQGQAAVKESDAKATGAGVGADDAADLPHLGLRGVEVIPEVSQQRLHLPGGTGCSLPGPPPGLPASG